MAEKKAPAKPKAPKADAQPATPPVGNEPSYRADIRVLPLRVWGHLLNCVGECQRLGLSASNFPPYHCTVDGDAYAVVSDGLTVTVTRTPNETEINSLRNRLRFLEESNSNLVRPPSPFDIDDEESREAVLKQIREAESTSSLFTSDIAAICARLKMVEETEDVSEFDIRWLMEQEFVAVAPCEARKRPADPVFKQSAIDTPSREAAKPDTAEEDPFKPEE